MRRRRVSWVTALLCLLLLPTRRRLTTTTSLPAIASFGRASRAAGVERARRLDGGGEDEHSHAGRWCSVGGRVEGGAWEKRALKIARRSKARGGAEISSWSNPSILLP